MRKGEGSDVREPLVRREREMGFAAQMQVMPQAYPIPASTLTGRTLGQTRCPLVGFRRRRGHTLNETGKPKRILDEAMRNETWVTLMSEDQRIQDSETRKLGVFPCPGLPPSDPVPTSVHRLRPSDIKVVAAIGDSYSTARAGGGISPINMLFDYRGNSWSIGGDQDYDFHTSMPNILREYNANLYGYSKSIGDCQRNLNEAIIGARSRGFANQATSLVTKLKQDPNVDFENDWKLITVFLGGNDLCVYCLFDLTAAAYTRNLRRGLDILYANIPRAFINLVVVMHVGLTQTLHNGLISTIMLRLACPCGAFPKSQEANTKLGEYTEAYQQAVLDLAASGLYDTDNFTVVAQPFYQNITIPYKDNGELDYSFFAIDRFHISKRGHSVSGRSLWNNMFEPVGNKTTQVDWYDTEIVCPTEEFPFLFTNQNSDVADYAPYRMKLNSN
ncbi:hypothetical protein EGW08_008588 [Elysia chlorotica]|uniref:Phospholipase B1, membrane-associated n=1 Tax=Elysia chlorotica TaxID=188477 RepID=A0A433TQ22_ELYCH|nr:hypothetical protein EGW08_008588 [Elysia chlorotica]